MTVVELIAALQTCEATAKVEMSDGTTCDDVCYNPITRRVSISTQDDRVAEENLAEHWFYVRKA